MKDLRGMRFGRLYVNYFTGKKYPTNGEGFWNCTCECGKEKIVRSGHLVSGKTLSCGCYTDYRKKLIKDLRGKTFGFLTVEYDTGRRSRGKIGNVIWHCKCKCGGEVDVSSGNLPNGAVKSCGCLSESYIASELKKYFVKTFSAKKEYNIVKNITGYWLPYDIYIPSGKNPSKNGVYIEVNGAHHYRIGTLHLRVSESTGRTPNEEFENQKSRDLLKKKFARKNGTYIEIDLRKIKSVEEWIDYIEKRMTA